jgi:hypothetical protein
MTVLSNYIYGIVHDIVARFIIASILRMRVWGLDVGEGVARAVSEAASRAFEMELYDCMHVLDGLVVPKFIKQGALDKLKDLPLRDDDVWI